MTEIKIVGNLQTSSIFEEASHLDKVCCRALFRPNIAFSGEAGIVCAEGEYSLGSYNPPDKEHFAIDLKGFFNNRMFLPSADHRHSTGTGNFG